MNALDIILFAFLGFGFLRGFWHGLFVEIASLVALIAGVYGAFHFSNVAATFFESQFNWNQNTINIVAFVTTLMAIIILISLAGKALTKIADFASLGLINKLLGAFFGGLKVAVILSAILIIFEKMNRNILFTKTEDKETSILYSPVKAIIPLIYPSLIVNGKRIGDTLKQDENTSTDSN